jgi:Alpha/beta hydrolase domain
MIKGQLMKSAGSGLLHHPQCFVVAALLSLVACSASATVPVPTVTGPVASDTTTNPRNHPFFATDIELNKRGYVEEEFFLDGRANVYDTPNPFGGIGNSPDSAPTASVVTPDVPYRTRMIVRRPADPERFRGVALIEWLNVTSGYDVDVHWFQQHEYLLRSGYAYVGVSAQNNGISATPNGLKAWNPVRYGTLDVTAGGTVMQDRLSYDIFSQAAQAVRSVPRVMGGLPVRYAFAVGASQSAGRLAIYLNAVHVRDPIFDGALLTVGGQKIRTDLSIPVIKLLSETEHVNAGTNELPVLQPDTDKIRIWGVAGASHTDAHAIAGRGAVLLRDLGLPAADNCTYPSRSRVRFNHVMNAGIDHLIEWIKEGEQPPHAPSFQILSVSPPIVARDSYGNAIGGIRLATIEVPVALDNGTNAGPGLCFLDGTHIPLDDVTLNALYPSHGQYESKVEHAARTSVQHGFVLPKDAQTTIEEAAQSVVGFGLVCGPLCADVSQFPKGPSVSLLLTQTEVQVIIGGRELIEELVEARRSIAEGYTFASGSSAAKRSFTEASEALERYIARVNHLLDEGRIAPETAALFTSEANTLIAALAAL